jgi:hypothetical protein
MGAELTRSIANCVAKPFFSVQRGRTPDGKRVAIVKQIKKAQPETALKMTTPAVQTLRKTGEKAMNLAYGQLVRDRAGYRQTVGDTARAQTEVKTLIGDLAKRGAHKVVLASYNELVRSLGRRGRKSGQEK